MRFWQCKCDLCGDLLSNAGHGLVVSKEDDRHRIEFDLIEDCFVHVCHPCFKAILELGKLVDLLRAQLKTPSAAQQEDE